MVLAKLVVAFGWCLVLVCHLVVISLVMGAVLRLPGWSGPTWCTGSGSSLRRRCWTVALATTYGLVASWGRGYLAAVAAMFVTLFAAQVLSAVGFGAWFPWAVPSLLSGVAGPDQTGAGLAGVASVVLVGLAASTATVALRQHADHDR